MLKKDRKANPKTTSAWVMAEGTWCIGWQNSGLQSRDRRNMTLLGGRGMRRLVDHVKWMFDLVLSNKLVLYDLENQIIGWTEYNSFSSIKVQDERTGTVHLAGSHSVSSACGTFACATGYVVVFVAKYTTAQTKNPLLWNMD
ncbi:hypothetical protein Peur_048832 [Populus x canadensis]